MKSSYLWDYKLNDFNQEISMQVLKSICGFMNSDGGNIIIGVKDNKEIIGIQNDIKRLESVSSKVYKPNLDSFMNFLKNDIQKKMGGDIIASKINFYPFEFDKKPVIRLKIKPNLIKPIIFPKNLKSSYAGKFFVRESAETKNYDDLEKILDHLYFRLISSEEEK